MRFSAVAPTRINDLGGWTDTWFAGHGAVCHLAVWPGVEATLQPIDGEPGVYVHVHSVGRRWHWMPSVASAVCPDPLIAACLHDAGVPGGAWELGIRSVVPPGVSMGTSASVCVAVLAALDAASGRRRTATMTPADLATRAHRVETVSLGQQCGIQDQWASAGGINLLEMPHYPEARLQRVHVTPHTRCALDAQLLVVLFGGGHHSSAVHADVVRALEDAGPGDGRLDALRACAHDGAAALGRGDLERYGAVMSRNTDVQAMLHPSLVNADARQVIDVGRTHGALGWKVNGAGGDGGSVTLLAASAESRTAMCDELRRCCPGTDVLDVRLAPSGVSVTSR